MKVGKGAWLFLSALSTISCGGEDGDEGWDCYVHTDTMVCECFIGGGEYGSTDVQEIDSCDDYARCFSYIDTFFKEPTCSCGDADYTPMSASTEVVEVGSCPD